MPSNGKIYGKPPGRVPTPEPSQTPEVIDKLSKEVLQDWNIAEDPPLKPNKNFKYVFSTRKKWEEKEFYQSIPWAEWWDEFNGAVDKNGRRKYKTVRTFAAAKAKHF